MSTENLVPEPLIFPIVPIYLDYLVVRSYLCGGCGEHFSVAYMIEPVLNKIECHACGTDADILSGKDEEGFTDIVSDYQL